MMDAEMTGITLEWKAAAVRDSVVAPASQLRAAIASLRAPGSNRDRYSCSWSIEEVKAAVSPRELMWVGKWAYLVGRGGTRTQTGRRKG